ncbi:Bug family tripartite tricarboxylate transporter substrate binding protein [Cupriavidus sp. 2TAF22]|uniref:Bug family tripartite tricarboxylate transporter substrate binding protein n=1 Tax=unclassified Cupriavidus TaxID=2640874 RepID=UPI003F90AB38
MLHTRRSFLRLGVAIGTGALALHAHAKELFPSKPVTLVVPFSPGGNLDLVTRSLGTPLGKLLGQTIVVVNNSGGSGSIGASLVARAKPDGYTLLSATPAQVATVPQLLKTPYKLSDFTSIGVVSRTAIVLVVRRSDTRFKNFEEFLAYARAHPGKLNVGHAGAGSPNHLAGLQFESAANVHLGFVGYKGMGPALIDLISGQIDVIFDQISSSLQHLKSGNLKALVVCGPSPAAAMPSIPTLKQVGVPEFDASTYIGILAPKQTPPDVVAILSKAVEKVVSDPQFAAMLLEMGSGAYYGNGQRFDQILKAEEEVAAALIKQGKLTAE